MDNRFDGLTSGLQQQRSNPPLLGNHAARLEQFGMRFDDLNRIRVLGLYRISSIYDVAMVNSRGTKILILETCCNTLFISIQL